MLSIRKLTVTGLVTLGVMLGGLALSSAPALALNTHVLSFSFGAGQVSSPDGVGINAVTHNVYVADRGNHRVDEFSSSGNPLLMFGKEVDKTKVEKAGTTEAEQNVCTVASGDTCQPGTEGSTPGAFETPSFLAVDNSCTLHTPVLTESTTPKCSEFDPSDGDVYVGDTGDNLVTKFSESGALIKNWGNNGPGETPDGQLKGPPSGSFSSLAGIAVDGSGILDVLNSSPHYLFKFAQSGSFSEEFQVERGTEPYGLGVDSEGNFFKVNGSRNVEEITGSNSAFAQVNVPEEVTTGIAVDSAGDLYTDESGYEEGSGKLAGPKIERFAFEGSFELLAGIVSEPGGTTCTFAFGSESGCPPTESFSSGAQSTADTGLAIDPTSGSVYVADDSANQVDVFIPAVLPDVTTEPATEVMSTSATVPGEVNPSGVAITECQFEYGITTSYGQPPEPCSEPSATEVGDGTSFVKVSAQLTGLTPNQTYHYRLVAANASFANRGEDGKFTTEAVRPAVNDRPPFVSATRTTARLSGTVNPENSPTKYHFEYGTTTAYGSMTGEANVGSGYGDVSVGPQVLVELRPETTYHYRLVATNEAVGTETGPDYTFTTAPRTPPLVDTGEAGGVTQTGANILGAVDPQGIETSYLLEVGTDTSYGGAKIFGDAGNGEGVEPIAVGLEDLAPGTTYHYRLTATNADGTSKGQDMTFTTAGAPSPITQPLTLPLIATPTIAFPSEPGKVSTTVKTLTKAQKLAKALKACEKDKSKAKRAACKKQVKKRYVPVMKKRTKKKKS